MEFVMFEDALGGKVAVRVNCVESLHEQSFRDQDGESHVGTVIKIRGNYGREVLVSEDFATVVSRLNINLEEREVW